jgi:hypothetical protein
VYVQLTVFELPREFPNVHLADAERPSAPGPTISGLDGCTISALHAGSAGFPFRSARDAERANGLSLSQGSPRGFRRRYATAI